MAQYKVPQDVEADDKLIGPFSFRQFVYLLIAGGLIGIGIGLFQIFPVLVLLPLPPILLLLALALPIKKDQPMETYLAALVSYYVKPHKRVWIPGQRDTTILITAPKIVEETRTRDITSEEATHRLSFLADIVDSGGQAIKGSASSMREDLYAEANATNDMFEGYQSQRIERAIKQDKENRHEDMIKEMREAIEKNDNMVYGSLAPEPVPVAPVEPVTPAPVVEQPVVEQPAPVQPAPISTPSAPVVQNPVENYDDTIVKPEKNTTSKMKSSIIDLANNSDFSVATIAKEANRIKRKEEGEVFISLH